MNNENHKEDITMKLKLLLLAVLLPLAAAAKVSVAGLLTEGLDSPLGLDTDRPRFSWKTVPAV